MPSLSSCNYKNENCALFCEIGNCGLFCEMIPSLSTGEKPVLEIIGLEFHLTKAKYDTTLVIPEEIDGYKVESVRSLAFQGSQYIKKVVLPDTIKFIGFRAFYDSYIQSINFGNGVKIIDENAFEECTDLKEINLSEGLMTINNAAFAGCRSLESIVLPDSLEKLGDSVFDGCESLKSIHIGANLSKIGSNDVSDFAYDCMSLDKITVSSQNKHFKVKNNILYDIDKKVLKRVFGHHDNVITIPSWVTSVASYSFDNIYLSNLIVKPRLLSNINWAGINHVENVSCIPDSQVERYFQKENVLTCSVNDSKLNTFLNEISEDIVAK